MPYRNEFVINGASKTATNKQNTLKIGNRVAYKFRSGIMNQNIRNYDPSENELFPQNTASAIPLPDNSLTTRYFKDGSIDSNKLAKNIVFPANTILINNEMLEYNPSSIQHVREYIVRGIQELQYGDSIEQVLGTFSDDIEQIPPSLIPIDASISIINEPDWVVESRIADGTITGDNYDVSYSLPSNIEIVATNNTTGLYVATTEYINTQFSQFIADASLNSVGKIANSIIDMTDASFQVFSSEKTTGYRFDSSYNDIDSTQSKFDNSLNSLISLNQIQNTTYRQRKTEIDSSLNFIYQQDISLSYVVAGNIVDPKISDSTSKMNRVDSSFSNLKIHIDGSFSSVLSNGWVVSDRFYPLLNVPATTSIVLDGIAIDSSSQQVVSTSYVKTKFAEFANSSVINSYKEFANAIGGDASFAYSVVSNLNNYDSSVVELNTKITSVENNGNSDLFGRTTIYENIERKMRQQDNLINTFSIVNFRENVDACLNSLNIKGQNTESILQSRTTRIDASMGGIYTQTTSSMGRLYSIQFKTDGSFSNLNSMLQTYSTNLVNNVVSLNSLLENRENQVDTSFNTNYTYYVNKWNLVDLSLSSLDIMIDLSYNRLIDCFNMADSSLAGIESGISDISTNNIPVNSLKIDNSLVLLRENQTQNDGLFDGVKSRFDQSLNYLGEYVENMNALHNSVKNNMTNNLTGRSNSLAEYYNTSVDGYTTNMNTISSGISTRENEWKMAIQSFDASLQGFTNQYNPLDRDAKNRQVYLGLFDTSVNNVYNSQRAQLSAIDNSLQINEEQMGERTSSLDMSLILLDQSVNILDYTAMNYYVNGMIEKTQLQDSSISTVESTGWVKNASLSTLVLPESAKIVVSGVGEAGDPSGNQLANVGFFRRLVDELVGMPVSPFSHLNQLAFALNNTGNYSILIEGYLNEIQSELSLINSGLSTLTNNTGGDFNYDASLIYLDGKINSLDTSANTIDATVNSWVSTVDNSFSLILSKYLATDMSLSSLEGRNGIIRGLVERQQTLSQLLDSFGRYFDASYIALDQSFVGAKLDLDAIVVDISSTRGVVSDLSGSFRNQFRISDASYLILVDTYQNIHNKNMSIVAIDSSLSTISTRNTTVGVGIQNYLRNLIEGTTYQSTFTMLVNRLGVRDNSINTISSQFDSSFSVFDGNNETRKVNVENLSKQIVQTDSSRVDIVQVSNTSSNDISTVNMNGWVVDRRLDSGIVLPSGVQVSVANTGISTASDVKTAIHDLVANAPNILNTLNEIADAFQNDTDLVGTIQSRLDSTDSSLSLLTQGLDGNIATLTGDYSGRVDSINSMVYPTVETNMDTMYRRMYSNDVSTNLAGAELMTVNTKVEKAIRGMETNDASTNYVDGRFLAAESALGMADSSLNGELQISSVVDSSLVSIRNIGSTILTGLGVNDASTNSIPSAIATRDISANTIISLLGRPDNFRVIGSSTTSITCGYVEPVLAAAMGVSSYRLTATPTYGTTTVVTNTAAVGTNAISATPLVSGAVYDLSLAATNQYGVVVVSGLSSPTVLAPPTLSAGSAITTTSFTASWTSGGGVFTKYAFRLENGGVNVSTGDLSNNVVSRNFTELTDGTPYLVVVRSANPFVQSVDASMMYGTIFVAPSIPTFVSRTGTDLFFSVAGTTKPYERYNISYKPSGGTFSLATDGSSNFRLRDLTAGKIYDVSVNIQNAFGVSTWSPVVKNSTTLSVPTSLSSTDVTDVSMTVNFSAALLTTQDVSAYVLRTNPATSQYLLTAGTSSRVITGLTEATGYEIILDASNLYTTSQVRNSALGTVFAAPVLPSFSARTANSINFLVPSTAKPFTQYNISYRPLGGTVSSAISGTNTMSLTDLTAGKIYDISVNIQNAYGVSRWSPVMQNSTTLITLPFLTASGIRDSSMIITFEPALPLQDCSYVLRTNPNVNQYVLTSGITTQTITGLMPATPYTIILDASNLYTTINRTTTATTTNIIYSSSLYKYYPFNTGDIVGNNVFNYSTQSAVLDSSQVAVTISTSIRKIGTGSAYFIKANSSHIKLQTIPANTFTTSGLSFSFWYYLLTLESWTRIFDFGNGPSSDNIIWTPNNGAGVWSGTVGRVLGNRISTTNSWVHVCWTLTHAASGSQTSTWNIYVNGALDFTSTTGTYPNISVSRTINYLGRSNWVADPYLNGYIDDFAIYNRVLSATEVSNIYYSAP